MKKTTMSKSFKELCDDANNIEAVNTKEALYEALPVLFALRDGVFNFKKLLDVANDADKRLADMCTKYALARPGCFDPNGMYDDSGREQRGLREKEGDVKVGDITIGDVVYHFVSGFKGYARIHGGNFSQDFFKGLPDEYKVSKPELNGQALGQLSNEELTALDIKHRENNVWSKRPTQTLD